ncbi:hypothetical protein [Dokdonella sp.]|uniref:hypothetical protein n=2 Tax=Dokdonella sp. TaxID=2291710 RepID=UPI002B8DE5FA|nr:hypothetical protein [Dokdonella sp.]HOX71794.1 hypothetical protein [Dokdonella sp.]HPN78371.1 hypothetical protein [Dokdonella sp.]
MVMTRWIMIAITLLGLVIALLTRSPGLLGIALLMMLVGLCGTVFSLAAERVSANTRPDAAMLPPEALAAIREKAKARAAAAPPNRGGAAPVQQLRDRTQP